MASNNKIGFLIFLCIVSSMGGLLFGYDIVIIGATIDSVVAQFELNNMMQGWYVSSALTGCLCGVIVAASICDRFGRKPTLILCAFFLALSSLMCGYAPNFIVLIIARIIGGIGVGLASSVAPLYISEISPAPLRGRMVSLFQFTITLGILAAMLVNNKIAALSNLPDGAEVLNAFTQLFVTAEPWRGMLLSEIIPASLFVVLCLLVPESPRWLAKHGFIDKARDILKKIRRPEEADLELRYIQDSLSEVVGSCKELFAPRIRKPFLIGIFLVIFSELSGITIVMFYGPNLFKETGLSEATSLDGHSVIGIVNVLFTLLSIGLVDVVGRRPLLFVGTAGCVLSLLITGILYMTGAAPIYLVALMAIYVAFFAFSLGPTKWIVISEIFPTRIAGLACAACSMVLWLVIIPLNLFFPSARDALGEAPCFFLFACCLAPQLYFVVKIIPETKSKTLEEIEAGWK